MYTAKNTPWLRDQKQIWNDKIYRRCLAIYNLKGKTAAANFIQMFTTSPVDGATNAPPNPSPAGNFKHGT